MAQGSSNKKVANRLVAASCAAVLAVYTAGYARTQSAADRLAAQVAERRAAVPAPERVTIHVPELQSPESIPVPARLIPQAPPVPDRARNTTDTPRKETEQTKVAAVVVPASVAEPASIEPPEPLPQVAVAAPPVNPAPAQVPCRFLRRRSRQRSRRLRLYRPRPRLPSRRGRTEPTPAGAIPATAISRRPW